MKKYLSALPAKMNFWNLFIGLCIGLAVGISVTSEIAPGVDEVLKLCRMDAASKEEDRLKRLDAGTSTSAWLKTQAR